MSKQLITGVLLAFGWVTVFSQEDSSRKPAVVFKGAVFDKTDNSPLPFATVTVPAQQKNYLCDSLGKFTVEHLPAGKYLIRITSTGYTLLTREIQIPGTGSFYPSVQEHALDQVVVTAVTGATRIKKTPVAIAIVSQKEMNRSTSTNVIDALLKSVPGISAITTGPNISKPFIRGLGYNRVLTLYDGIRQEGQQWGDEHGIEIDPYGISRAEIVKGPASLMYGSDAIAGVVNLIPGVPSQSEGKIKGDAVTEYHSNNNLAGRTVGLHYRKNSFMWSARGSAKAAMNYRNSIDGRVYNTGFKENNLSLMMGWQNNNTSNHFQANYYDNLQEIPDGSRDSLTRAFTYQTLEADKDDITNRLPVPANRLATYTLSPLHQHIQHFRIYHKGNYAIGKGNLSTLLGFQQNTRREYNHPGTPGQAGLYLRLNTVNYEIKYNFPQWAGIHFTYGVNGMYQDNKNGDATDFAIPDYQLFDIGTYLVATKEFNKTVITGGIRVDNRHIQWADFYSRKESATGFNRQVSLPDTIAATRNFTAYKHYFSGVSGSVGLVHTFSRMVVLKANMATGYRSPSIPEIGSDGLDPGAHIYYIGNRDFKPELNWQADIGLFVTDADWDANVELFNNRISHYIFFQKLFDANCQPLEIVPGNFTYQYKQGSANLYGAEANFNIHPGAAGWLSLQNNIAWINGINTDAESLQLSGDAAKYLPLIPPFKTVTRLRVSILRQHKVFSDAYLQTEVETSATQNKFYAVDNTETQTKGYTLFNIGAGFSLQNKKDKTICQLFINANNLFDVAYQSHQNRLKYFEYYQASPNGRSGIYNMGRNIAVKAIFSW